jgi:TerC family integral membrane protein
MSAMAFALLIYFIKGKQSSLEFLAGYLVEQSLSIDNLFFFVMLFNYFKVPLMYQNRVLKWGIIGAIVLRGIMIYWGIRLAENFKIVTLIFAIVLIVSSFKMLKNEEDDDNDLDNNYIMKISKRFMKTSDHYDGDKFFTVIDNATVATPLLLCLVCVELSDLVFAIDSIPAVLGVSHDSLIVYSSNIFAIMGLRSLYTLIAKAVADMPFIKTAIGLILVLLFYHHNHHNHYLN